VFPNRGLADQENPTMATRLGEFSPFGRLFTLGRFLKLQKHPKVFGYICHGEKYVMTLAKMGWDAFWAMFSQTHQDWPWWRSVIVHIHSLRNERSRFRSRQVIRK
jgi:hypothetical protein